MGLDISSIFAVKDTRLENYLIKNGIPYIKIENKKKINKRY